MIFYLFAIFLTALSFLVINKLNASSPASDVGAKGSVIGITEISVSAPTDLDDIDVANRVKPENRFSIKLTFVDSNGKLMANAKVSVTATGESKTTNEKGEVNYSSLRAASYKISIEHDGKTEESEFKITDTSNLNQSVTIRLQAVGATFPWWIVIVAVVVGIILFIFTKRRNKEDKKDLS